jgi:hypothetical protein
MEHLACGRCSVKLRVCNCVCMPLCVLKFLSTDSVKLIENDT